MRVPGMTIEPARLLGMTDEDKFQQVRRGTMLLGIQKIGFRDFIFIEPGNLNPVEWAEMKHHAERYRSILSDSSYFQRSIDIPG